MVCEDPISKITRAKCRTGGVAQAVDHLLCKHEVPILPKRKKLPGKG
jgi:hypothetical protein